MRTQELVFPKKSYLGLCWDNTNKRKFARKIRRINRRVLKLKVPR